ncbi:Permease protein PstA [Bacillus subtilis subsp. subtilis str. BSP1]|nr:Permease protein PstA [Bacillus subtilis subsp. subtilis str. BSP1]
MTHPLSKAYLLINALTRFTTFGTEKPYSLMMVSPGADAPNRSMPRTSPSSPVYLPHPNDEPISIARRFFTSAGRTSFLYSSDCFSKRSIEGMLTTETSIFSFANSACASIARPTSDPEAMRRASGVSFLDLETTYAPFSTPANASSAV